jgi:hypothetical protein
MTDSTQRTVPATGQLTALTVVTKVKTEAVFHNEGFFIVYAQYMADWLETCFGLKGSSSNVACVKTTKKMHRVMGSLYIGVQSIGLC